MQERLPTAPQPEMPPTQTGGGREPSGTPAHLADPRALQILATEHWSLLSQRSLAWTETFSRAGMYLATLSAATVALALVGSVMRDGFVAFALVILPVVLFLGLATAVRLSQANVDDNIAVQGMNRIRHAYLEIVPDLAPYFVTSRYDDVPGMMVTVGAPPDIASRIGQPTLPSLVGGFLHGFVTTIGMIMVINCVVGGVTAAIAAAALGAADTTAIVVGFVGGLILFAAQAAWGLRSFQVATGRLTVRFPTPPLGD
jgi:hypothetical protein